LEVSTVSERFTDRARKMMHLASVEAQRFNHEYVGTEHLLLALVGEGGGVAAEVLQNLGVHLRTVRLNVERIVQPGPDVVMASRLPQTPRLKKAMEYAFEESGNLNHDEVGTGHLLLGLLREEEGVAAQVLVNLGLTLGGVRAEVLRLLGGCDPLRGASGPHVPARRCPWLGVQELPAEELPARVGQAMTEMLARIGALNREKEEAVAAQDFERAAHLRDQADRLFLQKRGLFRVWWRGLRVDSSWLTRNDGTVTKLVRAIYDERRFDELPVLADLLEEVGCTDREILDHLRQPREHRDGCWVIDLFLENLVSRHTPPGEGRT
jgi:hypothetical protein